MKYADTTKSLLKLAGIVNDDLFRWFSTFLADTVIRVAQRQKHYKYNSR